jgi:hypothetical protein
LHDGAAADTLINHLKQESSRQQKYIQSNMQATALHGGDLLSVYFGLFPDKIHMKVVALFLDL